MSNDKAKLPGWFDWANYQRLIDVDDLSVWAYEFAKRDPNCERSKAKGAGFLLTLNDGSTRTAWRNGVLSYGIKGHETHAYLSRLAEGAAANADYLTAEQIQKRGADGTIDEYPVRVSQGDGALCFKTMDEYERFNQTRKAVFSQTVELAINTMMPAKRIIDEVTRLIEEYQSIDSFKLQVEAGKTYQTTRKQQTWARGLACWDLREGGYIERQITKLIGLDWWHFKNSKDPIGNAENEVKQVIANVHPLINGGWKALAGDPTVSAESDLLKQYRHPATLPKKRGR